jgi:hypothetical protein
LLVEEGERAALYFQRKDFEIVRKIKFAPKPNKPRRLDTLSNVLGDVRVGSNSEVTGHRLDVCFTPNNGHGRIPPRCPKCAMNGSRSPHSITS